MAEGQVPAAERPAVLAAFARALGQEAHILRTRPEILWQQLHNRLQWEVAPVPDAPAPAFAERSRTDVDPWLRTRTPFRESSALIRTIAGHRQVVNACAISPDGRRIVSASDDRTLKLWDAASGAELRTRPDHQSLGCRCWSSTGRIGPARHGKRGGHPFESTIVCGDGRGGLHFARLSGVDLGPLVVTAAIAGRTLTVACPACREVSQIGPDRLGTDTTCPAPKCGRPLRVNRFVLRPHGRPDSAAAVQ